MKNTVILVAMAGLVACGSNADEADGPMAAAAADEIAEAPVAADGNPSVGLYRAVDQNGVVLMEELRPDRTYAFADEAGAMLEEGQWAQKSPNELCFTANSQGAAEVCYQEEISEDGTWVSTNAQTGETATIERLQDNQP